MAKINIAFFGTDNFSVPFLQYLAEHNNIVVKYVVTKKEKKVGRGGTLQKNIVEKVANTYKIPTVTVTSLLKNPNQLDTLNWKHLDFAVVVSFGFILPSNVLKLKKGKFINVHPSILPKYRGASPIISALLNGDTQTGVSIMVLQNNVDAGPILAQQVVDIHQSDDISTLNQKLTQISLPLLTDTLQKYKNNQVIPVKQDHAKATFSQKIVKSDGYMTLNEKPVQIYNKYRALKNWPGIFTKVSNLELFLDLKTKIADKSQFVKIKQVVLTDTNKIAIQKLQLPNKPVISLQDFINGYGAK